jgi:hypothetical protein
MTPNYQVERDPSLRPIGDLAAAVRAPHRMRYVAQKCILC